MTKCALWQFNMTKMFPFLLSLINDTRDKYNKCDSNKNKKKKSSYNNSKVDSVSPKTCWTTLCCWAQLFVLHFHCGFNFFPAYPALWANIWVNKKDFRHKYANTSKHKCTMNMNKTMNAQRQKVKWKGKAQTMQPSAEWNKVEWWMDRKETGKKILKNKKKTKYNKYCI